MKILLFGVKAEIEASRKRIALARLSAIERRNAADTELLGDILSHLDDALFCIDHDLKPRLKKGK